MMVDKLINVACGCGITVLITATIIVVVALVSATMDTLKEARYKRRQKED